MLPFYCLVVAAAVIGLENVLAANDPVDLCQLPENDIEELPASCNFNDNLCGYSFPTELWSTHTESFGGFIYGPIEGDNGGGQNQTFAVFQSNDPNVNESAIMTSKIISPVVYSDRVCLKFWYLMPNQNSKLEVYTRTVSDNVSTLVYEYKYQSTSTWKQVKLSIDEKGPFKIEFVSEKENNYGYLGIDHIQVVIEKIITTTTITIATTTTATEQTTTTTERTTTTLAETTMVMDQTSQTPGNHGHVSMTKRGRFVTTAITPDITTTTEPETTSTTTTEPTTTTTTMTTTTTEAETTTSSSAITPSDCVCNCPNVSTVCASDIGTTVPSAPTLCDMPDDNLSILNQYSCNFDQDLCGYDLPIYPHLWERTSYKYGDLDVGYIQGDHSSDGTGSYIVFNTYNTHVQNNSLHLLTSSELLPYEVYCVSFWYIMPTNQSLLRVYTTTSSTDMTVVWSHGYAATLGWQQAKIAVSRKLPFRLEFVGVKISELSFFALDDVNVAIERPHLNRSRRASLDLSDAACVCNCPSVQVVDCSHTTTSAVPPFHSCKDLTSAVLENSMSCNFDSKHTCGYMIPIYPHLWELIRYRYGNDSMGIIERDSSSYDGSGMYVIFSTDNYHVPVGEKAELISPDFRGQGKMCFSFMYNLPTKFATLSVYVESSGQRQMVWETKDQTNGWAEATLILNYNETFQVAFYAEKNSLDSYFGVDDIRLYTHV